MDARGVSVAFLLKARLYLLLRRAGCSDFRALVRLVWRIETLRLRWNFSSCRVCQYYILLASAPDP